MENVSGCFFLNTVYCHLLLQYTELFAVTLSDITVAYIYLHTFTFSSQSSFLSDRNACTSVDGTNEVHCRPDVCHISATVASPCRNQCTDHVTRTTKSFTSKYMYNIKVMYLVIATACARATSLLIWCAHDCLLLLLLLL